ncbi:MAG: BrnT family toxin [Methylocystis sp.]
MFKVRYEFDWDPAKAASNFRKHGVRFEEAMSIFSDPRALTIYDEDQSDVALNSLGSLLVVVHPYIESGKNQAKIRIIPVRSPTKNEARQ